MNPHIELVKKWLADDKSVSLEELKENKKAAWDASIYAASSAIGYAAYAAADSAYGAADAADAVDAAYWRNRAIKHVKKHEELTK